MAGSSSASMDEDDKFMYYLNSIQQAFSLYESESEAADTWGHEPPKPQGFVAQESYPYQIFAAVLGAAEMESIPIPLSQEALQRQAFKSMLFLSGIVKALNHLDCEVIFKDLVCIADEQIETPRSGPTTIAEQDIEQLQVVPSS